MCLAIPAQILAVEPDGATATVSLGGVRRPVSLALVDDIAVGDYVLVHVGYALNKIGIDEAEQTLALMAELGAFEAAFDAPPAASAEAVR